MKVFGKRSRVQQNNKLSFFFKFWQSSNFSDTRVNYNVVCVCFFFKYFWELFMFVSLRLNDRIQTIKKTKS